VPAATAGPLLEPFILEHEKIPWNSSQENWHNVVRAIAVLLFSDDPKVGIERIRKLPEERLQGADVRHLLFLLASTRCPEATDLIIDLAMQQGVSRRDNIFYEAATLLSQSPNPRAEMGLVRLLEKLCDGEIASDAVWDLARALAKASKSKRSLEAEIRRRCKEPQSDLERGVLVYILCQIADYGAALSLCDLLTNHEMPLQDATEHIIEEAVTEHVPRGGNAYSLKPRNATELKKRLMRIALEQVRQRRTATGLLALIRKCRLERGWPVNEPVHPDIELLPRLEVPWLLLARKDNSSASG
jgi:hypothetical protein